MGSPLTNTAGASAALANADRVTGGGLPPATRPSALGVQRDIAHDRALYDMGARGRMADVAGGSATTYYGTIVPENPQKGQVTEERFLQVLAEEFSRQMVGIGMGDGPDPEFVEVSRGMLAQLFQIIIPPGARMERVLRAALKMSPSLDDYYSVNDFASGLMEMLKPFIDNLDLITGLAANIEAVENARSEDDMELAAAKLFSMAGIMWFPRRGEKPEKFSFRDFVRNVGNQVHSMMQAHYWITHTSDIIMFEDFLVAGPGILTKIWTGTQWGGAYEWIPMIRAALRATSREDAFSTKRPDIFNLTGKALYEIKTIHGAPGGVKQVMGYYNRLVQVMPDIKLAGMGPNDWRPFPLYYVGGSTVVTTSIYAPGVIAYQRVGTRIPGVNPLQSWSQEKQQYYQRQAHRARVGTAIALVTVGFMGVLLLAAGIAVAAAAAGAVVGGGAVAGGGAVVGGAATKWGLGTLAVGSGLAFAM